MEMDAFLSLCIERGISILHYKNEDLDRYKKLTEHFNYPCHFSEEGICSARSDSKCCCSNCECDVGYFKKIRGSAERMEEYASKFDKTHGFWRHDTGCILPRELRSATCTGFVCGTVRGRFKYLNNGDISTFMRLLYFYNELSPKEKKGLNKLYVKIKNTL